MKWKSSKCTGYNVDTRIKASPPPLLPRSRPVKVTVKLSDESFIRPFSGVEADRYDICINVFYNGHLNTSRIINYSAWTADREQNTLHFSGRRIGTSHELPWMLTTELKSANNSKPSSGIDSVARAPLERWNELKKMLLVEADEWGRDENGGRCPTGEYLELLSKKAMPSDLEKAPVNTGCKFGIVDVVITFGRLSRHDKPEPIRSPHRYLPERHFRTTDMINGTQGGRNAARSLPAPQADSFMTEASDAAMALAQPYVQISSSTPEATTASTSVLDSSNPQQVMQQATSMASRTPTTFAPDSTSKPPHPGRPKTVPQKRYRGNEPILPPAPEPKRQKTTSSLEELPFDLNASAYMSTRSRQSASTSFSQTPPTGHPETTIKKKSSVKQAKSALVNTESSDLTTDTVLSTPKKIQTSDPKTPQSNRSAKKKSRFGNPHPKFSNRPQNLRRKNSAGEWYIPTTRKNSAGEWETPTNNRKPAKAIGSLGGQIEGSSPEGTERIFQPVFKSLADTTNPDVAIGQTTAGRTSMTEDYPIFNENITQMSKEGQNSAAAVMARTIQSPRLLQDGEHNRDYEVGTATACKNVENFHQAEKVRDTMTGIDIESEKKSIRIRFFQANKISAREAVGTGAATKTWQAQRYSSPEYTPPPGSGKKPSSSSLFSESTPKPSTSAISHEDDEASNSVTGPNLKSTAMARRQSSSSNKIELKLANNPVIATLRGTGVEDIPQLQTSDVTKSRPRFLVPNHNLKVLRLVSRQGVCTEGDLQKQDARGPVYRGDSHNLSEEKIGLNESHHPNIMDTGDQPILAVEGSFQDTSRQIRELQCSSEPQSVRIANTDLVTQSGTSLVNAKELAQVSNSGAQTAQGAPVSGHLLSIGATSKPPPRPRTVGSSELKALLESHDRGNTVNNTPGAPLGIMHTKLMTRASSKAVSYKTGKVVVSGEDVGKTKVEPNMPSVRFGRRSENAPRKRSSSIMVVAKTAISDFMQKDTKNLNGEVLKAVDTLNGGEANSDEAYEIEIPSTLPHNGDTPKPITRSTVINNFSLLSAGEAASVEKPAALKIRLPTSRPQKGVETRADLVMSTGVYNFKSAAKMKTPIVNSSHQIRKPTSGGLRSKETALQAGVGNTAQFKQAVDEADVTPKRVGKSRRINVKAAEDLESPIIQTPTARKPQGLALIHAAGREPPSCGLVGKPIINSHGGQEQEAPAPASVALENGSWKPSRLCEESILTYAGNEKRGYLERNPLTGQVHRQVGTQEEEYFRAFGVLMGVRYVVVGSEVLKEQEVRYSNGENSGK
jgi:hypothetical protein